MKSPNPYRWIFTLRHPSLRSLFDLPTHLTDREKIALYRMASKRVHTASRAIRVVEIGAYLGASSSFMAAGLGKDGGEVLCIDTWTNDAMSEGNRETFSEFLANTRRFKSRIRPVRGWSHDKAVIDEVSAAPDGIDLLFVDGDHSYEGVLKDWEHYSPLLASGAVVAMHDYGWAEGVQRVVAENNRPLVSCEWQLPNLWWGQLAS